MTEHLTFQQLMEANPVAAAGLVDYWAEQSRCSERLARVTLEESGEVCIRYRGDEGRLEFMDQHSGEWAWFDNEKGWWCYGGLDGWPEVEP